MIYHSDMSEVLKSRPFGEETYRDGKPYSFIVDVPELKETQENEVRIKLDDLISGYNKLNRELDTIEGNDTYRLHHYPYSNIIGGDNVYISEILNLRVSDMMREISNTAFNQITTGKVFNHKVVFANSLKVILDDVQLIKSKYSSPDDGYITLYRRSMVHHSNFKNPSEDGNTLSDNSWYIVSNNMDYSSMVLQLILHVPMWALFDIKFISVDGEFIHYSIGDTVLTNNSTPHDIVKAIEGTCETDETVVSKIWEKLNNGTLDLVTLTGTALRHYMVLGNDKTVGIESLLAAKSSSYMVGDLPYGALLEVNDKSTHVILRNIILVSMGETENDKFVHEEHRHIGKLKSSDIRKMHRTPKGYMDIFKAYNGTSDDLAVKFTNDIETFSLLSRLQYTLNLNFDITTWALESSALSVWVMLTNMIGVKNAKKVGIVFTVNPRPSTTFHIDGNVYMYDLNIYDFSVGELSARKLSNLHLDDAVEILFNMYERGLYQ